METMFLTAMEAKKEVAYTGILHIHLIDGELYIGSAMAGVRLRPTGGKKD
jgi:hypothetical protein